MQNTHEPVIRPLPTVEAFKKTVDMFIHGDMPDAEIKAFIGVITTVANAEDQHSWELAQEAARHAYTKTDDFHAAFRKFGELGSPIVAASDHFIVEARREM